MSKLITNNIKLFNVDQFIESFSEPNFNIYYYFIGNPIPYTEDASPPTLIDTVQTTLFDTYNNMIYGKRITSDDVCRMTPRHNWVAGTVYQQYVHDIDNYQNNFYVLSNEGSSYSVFKCLNNNNGAPSTYQPSLSETSADDDFYFTPTDGYQWKYMYSITTTQYNKFATTSHIPVFTNANVVGNAVYGSIDSIVVTSGGDRYASYTNGAFQEVKVGSNPKVYAIDPNGASPNNDFYINSALKITSGDGSGQQRYIVDYIVSGSSKLVIVDSEFDIDPTTNSHYEITPLVTVTGDGSGALARAIVNTQSNTIYSIEVVSRGEGYTHGSVVVTGNTGIINVVTGNTITANTATAKVILSPKGGHGSNAAAELGAHYVGISTTFDSSLSGGKVVDSNDFRVVGIIKDPLFANVEIDISLSSGTFLDGEEVSQSLGSPISTIVITSAGSGYTSNSTVTISGTNTVQALANAEANSSGRISIINIANNGAGYITPTATVNPPDPVFFNANSAVDSATDFISISNNVFQNNDFVKYLVATGNTAITGLSNNTSYYIVSANSTGLKLSSSLNGANVDITKGLTQNGHSFTGQTATVIPVVDLTKTTTARGIVYAANDSVVKLTNAYGFFVTGNSTVSLLYGNSSTYTAVSDTVTQPTTYIDQTYKVTGTLDTAQNFSADELVVQSENANGFFYYSNNTTVRLVDKKGTINQSEATTPYYITGVTSGAQFLVSGITSGDLVDGSGDVIYIENFTPVTKTPGQTETIKLILEF